MQPGDYCELQNTESCATVLQHQTQHQTHQQQQHQPSLRSSGGVVYSSGMSSPCHLYDIRNSVGSPTPDRVLTRHPPAGFTLPGLARRLRHLRRRLFGNSRPSHQQRQRVSMARSRRSSMSAIKQRTLIQSTASAASATTGSTAAASGAGRLAGSIDFVDIPLNDNTFFNWSSSPLSEKRSSL